MTFRSVKNPLNYISISDILVKIKMTTNIIISTIIQLCNSTIIIKINSYLNIRFLSVFVRLRFSRISHDLYRYILNYSLNVFKI